MLSIKDIGIITEIVANWDDIVTPMYRIFGSDISPAHWIKAGEIKGQRVARKMTPNISLN